MKTLCLALLLSVGTTLPPGQVKLEPDKTVNQASVLAKTGAEKNAGRSHPPKSEGVSFVGEIAAIDIQCNQTTEAGEDEIYWIVASEYHNGSSFRHRNPSQGHISINDGADDPNIKDWRITHPTLNDGDTWDAVYLLMEEDQGSYAAAADVASAILAETGVPFLVAASAILPILSRFIYNSDDFIGSFAVRLRNQGGVLYKEWKPLDRTETWQHHTNGKMFKMTGDGSLYYVTVHANIVR